MYYVAKLSTVFKPTIVEDFEEEEQAFTYARVMNQSNKGKFIVLSDAFAKDAINAEIIEPKKRLITTGVRL